MESAKGILTFESVDEILWCGHSNKTSSAILSHNTMGSGWYYFVFQHLTKWNFDFGHFVNANYGYAWRKMKKNRIAVSCRAVVGDYAGCRRFFSRLRRLSAAEILRGRPQADTSSTFKAMGTQGSRWPDLFHLGVNSNFLSSISYPSYDEGGQENLMVCCSVLRKG